MKKQDIKKKIDAIYNETINHKGLPSAYRVGMTIFKREVVNFISSNAVLNAVGGAVWVSAKEKKPKHLQDVLMGHDDDEWVCSGYYNKTEKKWYNTMESEADGDVDCSPTHWMELPKAPKG